MKKTILFVLICIFMFGCATPFKKMDGAAVGDTLYARSNLMVNGDTIFWHNMSGFKGIIPAGTEINILHFSRKAIIFIVPGEEKKYRLLTETANYDKYFVKDKDAIGLEKLSSDVMKKIKGRMILEGMTKEEVFISRGCPAFIGWGEVSLRRTFESAMKSDTWYYYLNSRNLECLVKFKDGVVNDIVWYRHKK